MLKIPSERLTLWLSTDLSFLCLPHPNIKLEKELWHSKLEKELKLVGSSYQQGGPAPLGAFLQSFTASTVELGSAGSRVAEVLHSLVWCSEHAG